MNKEYDKNNTGSLWLSDKLTKKGEKYHSGTITIDNKEYYINMFNNSSDNPKAPLFRLLVSEKKYGQAPVELSQTEITKAAMNEESDPFSEFNDEVQLTSDDLPF